MRVFFFRLLTLFLVAGAGVLSRAETQSSSEVFGNKVLFKIQVEAKESEWTNCNNYPGRQEKNTQYTFNLVNLSANDLKDISGSYCLYDNSKSSHREVYKLDRIKRIAAGQTVSVLPTERHLSVKGEPDPMQTVFLPQRKAVGIRARFVMVDEDGTEVVREITYPKSLSEKKYPWVEQFDSSALLGSSSYPDKELSKKEVKELVNQYIEAVKKQDFDAWVSLLSPMHPNHEHWNKGSFEIKTRFLDDIDIEEIDGLNVVLEVEFGHRKQLGYLQIHSSGYIKYTPIVFRHPVSQGFEGLDFLLCSDVERFSQLGIATLKSAGVPLFGFDPKSSVSANAGSVKEILNWLMIHGREYDVTEPKVHISPPEFEALVDDLKQKYGYMFN